MGAFEVNDWMGERDESQAIEGSKEVQPNTVHQKSQEALVA